RKTNNSPSLNYYINKVNSQKNHETQALHPLQQSSGIFSRKQEIIIMPNHSTKNNNNNNSNKLLKDTLPQSSVTPTSQQQQQHSQLSTVYAKEKSNSINVHFRQ
ncbi:unnamed protein product, partial [Trichobilharzia szidati]